MSSPFTCIERCVRHALLLLLCLLSLPAFSQGIEKALMPGAVIEGHAKYEADCEQCHRRFDKTAQTRLCLDCHKDIAADIRNRSRLHGRMDQDACRSCHTEHKGRGANIAPLDKKKFDHDRTEYRLAGAHREAQCDSCHVSGKKYRQAPHRCNDCHEKDDNEKGHKGHLGSKCDQCHNEKDWKDARFDHEKTRFSLRGGKHADVKCADCHADKTYRQTPKTCHGCHKKDDQEKGHKGRYGVKCESCHNDRGWKESTFNHDHDTRYPLKGKHRPPLKCAACHLLEKGGPTIYQEKLSTRCVACHRKDDQEKGHHGELGEKCESCHNERGWKTSDFDHDETRFPLVDRHRDVKCDACHVGGVSGPNARIRLDTACVACHRKTDDAKGHKGRYGERCDDCHTQKGWKTVRFEHDRDTRYLIRGKHRGIRCDACHVPEKGPIHKSRLDTACIACHLKDDRHKGQVGRRCENCHDETRWKGTPYDHDRARFPLTGSHRQADCVKCHKTPAFRDAPSNCYGCHGKDDKHDGRFGNRCDACHYTGTWKSWDHDHSKTRFPLDGAHRVVACEQCHRGTGPSAAKPQRTCVACHARDDVHDGGFGAQCERCHVTSDWKRARR